ncbi:hypothetical protein [Nocardia fluminea]|uniref:hypothetical protein n=1 Tax=Nocardia fluminea TaxID=134984 RepID=UPI003658F668
MWKGVGGINQKYRREKRKRKREKKREKEKRKEKKKKTKEKDMGCVGSASVGLCAWCVGSR